MLVLNLFGPPCSGKSTLAAGIFYSLKCRGYNVEMALEYVKDSVYDGNSWPFKDQIYVFANQLKRLRQYEGKVDIVVTDSPLLLSHVFAGKKECKAFHELIDYEWSRYENLNFFLDYSHIPYTPNGRKSKHDHRDAHTFEIMKLLLNRGEKFTSFSPNDPLHMIMSAVYMRMDKAKEKNIRIGQERGTL